MQLQNYLGEQNNMVFGFAKSFVIFLFIAGVVAWGTHNIMNGLSILAVFIIIRIIWKLLT